MSDVNADEEKESVRALVIRADTFMKSVGITSQVVDPFENLSASVPASRGLGDDHEDVNQDLILEPPYDPLTLIRLTEMSTALSSALDVYNSNVSGFGHRLASVYPGGKPDDPSLEAEANEERRVISNRLAALIRGMSVDMFRSRVDRDRDETGNSFVEVIRNRAGEIVAARRLPPYQVRLIAQDDEYTNYMYRVRQTGPAQENSYIDIPDAKRFRRYIQAIVPTANRSATYIAGDRVRFFREYGDPRALDSLTGEYLSDAEAKAYAADPKKMFRLATEIYHAGDSSYSPYGVPTWVSAIVPVMGNWAADQLNVVTINNNGIPSVIISLSGGGRLTAQTVERIQQYLNDVAVGSGNHAGVLVLEAESSVEGPDQNNVTIDVKTLSDAQVRDMLYQEYIQNNEKRVFESLRVPRLLVGDVSDYTETTADVSRKIADEQVFSPLRNYRDWWWNEVLFAEWNVKHWRFVSNSPTVTDAKDLITMLASAERTGAITPEIATSVVHAILPSLAEGGHVVEGIDMTTPYTYQLALAAKHQGDTGEPNQLTTPVMGPVDPDKN